MARITFQGHQYSLLKRESVLDGLLRHGVHVPSACRTGVCQSCMMRSTRGAPSAPAQKGLRDSLKASDHFLACQCHPTTDMEVALPGDEQLPRVTARVMDKQVLSPRVMLLRLQCPEGFAFREGQFINLFHGDTARSYSIANPPDPDRVLELHVYRVDNGRVSTWIHTGLAVGDSVTLQGPFGDCFYHPEHPEQPLLLIGTGCGLAPLRGVLRRALQQGHSAPIHLFHGSRTRDGVYLEDEMRALKDEYPQFHYTACLSGEVSDTAYAHGRAADIALARHAELKGWRLYLCGNSAMVKAAKRKAYLAGAALAEIHSDPFEFSHGTAVSAGA